MTVTLSLSSDIEKQLKCEAARLGLSVADCALQIIQEHLPVPDRREELVHLLQSWIDSDDEEDQKRTGETVIRLLDEDRLSDRKLFPAELRGVTW